MRFLHKSVYLVLILFFLTFFTGCQSLTGVQMATITPRATSANPTRTLDSADTPLSTSTPQQTPSVQPTVVLTKSPPAVCNAVPVIPAANPEVDKLIPNIVEEDHVFGLPSARVTIIEYTDFQCATCSKLAMNLRQLQTLYPEDVRVVLRYLLLVGEHDKSSLAAQAAEAAALQDKYWEMHDLLFTKQDEWVTLSIKQFSTWLIQQSKALKMDDIQFAQDLTSEAIVKKVFKDTQDSTTTTLTVPPALFFNKIQYQDWTDLNSLSDMISLFKLDESGFTTCPEMVIDPDKKYTVTFSTQKGEIVIELYPKEAPLAVNSFVFLARQQWFDNTPFYRVVPGFLVQAGDPSGTGYGNAGYVFSKEITPDLRFNQPGMLALSSYGEASSGSQFFINYAPIPEFDGQYTIFGKVIDGMDVLNSLRPRDPKYDQVLFPADILISVTVDEK